MLNYQFSMFKLSAVVVSNFARVSLFMLARNIFVLGYLKRSLLVYEH